MDTDLQDEPMRHSQSALPLPDQPGESASQKIKNWLLSHLAHGLLAIAGVMTLAMFTSVMELEKSMARMDERQKSIIENLGTFPDDVRDFTVTLKYINEKLDRGQSTDEKQDTSIQDLKQRVTTLEAKQPAREEWRRAFSVWLKNQ